MVTTTAPALQNYDSVMDPNNRLPVKIERPQDRWSNSIEKDHALLVNFMGEDNDFIVFRRFRQLRTLNILSLQSKLVDLDRDARIYLKTVKTKAQSNESVFDELPPDVVKTLEGLEEMEKELTPALEQYDRALLAYHKLNKIKSPPDVTINLLKEIANGGKDQHPCFEALRDIAVIDRWGDFMGMVQNEKGLIHRFVDKKKCLNQLFGNKDAESGQDSANRYHQYSEDNVRSFEKVTVNIITCLLLMAPVVALALLENTRIKLMVILLSLPLAAIASPLLASTAAQANFAVLAAYGAVLVAFMTNENR